MDEENRKSNRIGAITFEGEESHCFVSGRDWRDDAVGQEQQTVEIWSESWQCYISGAMVNPLAPVKRDREGNDVSDDSNENGGFC